RKLSVSYALAEDSSFYPAGSSSKLNSITKVLRTGFVALCTNLLVQNANSLPCKGETRVEGHVMYCASWKVAPSWLARADWWRHAAGQDEVCRELWCTAQLGKPSLRG